MCAGGAEALPRIPAIEVFWFGWFAFHSETEIDHDLAEQGLIVVRQIVSDEGRRQGVFGSEVQLAPGASTLYRMIAFTGRDPNWSAAS